MVDTSNVSHLLVPKEITITNTEMLNMVQQEVEHAGQVPVVHPFHKVHDEDLDPHLAASDLGHHICGEQHGGELVVNGHQQLSLISRSELVDDAGCREEVLSDFVEHEVSMGDQRDDGQQLVPGYVLRKVQLHSRHHGDGGKEHDLSLAETHEELVLDGQPLGQYDAPVGGERDIFVKEVLRDVSGQPDLVPHLQAVPDPQEHRPGHDEEAGSVLNQQNIYILTTRSTNIRNRPMMRGMAFWVLVRRPKVYSSITLNNRDEQRHGQHHQEDGGRSG